MHIKPSKIFSAVVLLAAAASFADLNQMHRDQQALANLVESLSPQVVAITVGRVIRLEKKQDSPDSDQYDTIIIPVRGSGCVLTEDGEILTNEHLINQARVITVRLWNGKEYPAKIVGSDTRSDLAVLKIQRSKMTPVRFGDLNRIKRGYYALAMGNPLGLAFDGQSAVSLGIISAIGRHVSEVDKNIDRYYGNLIQTSAQISVGNSGGPLFNLDGEVIGINTIISATKVSGSNVGFAIPISRWTKSIISKLRKGKKVEYGYLGILLTNLHGQNGAMVLRVVTESPAGRAGIRHGDIIMEYAGEKVTNVDHLIMLIGQTEPGHKVALKVKRKNKIIGITLRVASRKKYVK